VSRCFGDAGARLRVGYNSEPLSQFMIFSQPLVPELEMRHLLGAAILAASFVVATSVEAQTPSTTTEARARYLANTPPASALWSNPYVGRVARQRPRRYLRRTHRPAGFYEVPRHYPAQHELPPIYYGSRFGF
jgi:hypothetical protein